MIKVVSNSEMRSMDARCIDTLGVPGIILMENAGRHTFEFICDYMTENDIHGPVHIYCGKGNNGGDGYVIGRHLFNAAFNVELISVGDPGELKGDAQTNYRICQNYQVPLQIIKHRNDLKDLPEPALIVDALLGTGLKGAVSGLMKHVVEYINSLPAPVIAVDIPSGLSGDSAAIDGPTIMADLTITMALPKNAHLFYPAKSMVGLMEIADISMPDFVINDPAVKINLVEYNDLLFPVLDDDAHKYNAGKLFILAGSPGMTGAASLAASAALRTGVGLVNVGIPAGLNAVMEVKLTEALTVPLAETASGGLSDKALPKIKERLEWADAVVIGPGCGRDPETISTLIGVIRICQETGKPTLIDADALFALAQNPKVTSTLGRNFVLTPHHGEFLRLCPLEKENLAREPWLVLQTFLSDKLFALNLKGAPSMVGVPEGHIYINSTGHAGLAKGGSGDVLSGIIGGLMARGLEPVEAAITGNYVHGEAADLLYTNYGAMALLPSDLLAKLPEIFRLED